MPGPGLSGVRGEGPSSLAEAGQGTPEGGVARESLCGKNHN